MSTATKYNTIIEEAEGEIVEKKSRFICNLYHVESEEEIAAYVEALRKKHYQSRHVCHAAILGDSGDILKYSDDGEPSGTAGRPMLDILKGRNLTYTLACVTRYFGGVLLGTGGLVRAYSDSLQAGLENANIVSKELCTKLSFSIDYQLIGKIKYGLDNFDAKIISEEYGTGVDLVIKLPVDNTENYINYLTELTGGKVVAENLGVEYV